MATHNKRHSDVRAIVLPEKIVYSPEMKIVHIEKKRWAVLKKNGPQSSQDADLTRIVPATLVAPKEGSGEATGSRTGL